MAPATPSEPVKLNVTLKYRTPEEFEAGFAANVGTGVVFLRTHMPKPIGTPVSVQLNLAGGEPVLKGVGQVIHIWAEATMPSGHQSGMLVKFMPSDDASGMLVRSIIAKHGEGINVALEPGPKTKVEAPRVTPATPPAGATGNYEKGFSPSELAQSLVGDGLILAPSKPTTPAGGPDLPRPPPKAAPTAAPTDYVWKKPEATAAKSPLPVPSSPAPVADKKALPSLSELVSASRPTPPPAADKPAIADKSAEPVAESSAPSLSSLVSDSFRKPKATTSPTDKPGDKPADKSTLPSLADLVASSRPATAATAPATPPTTEPDTEAKAVARIVTTKQVVYGAGHAAGSAGEQKDEAAPPPADSTAPPAATAPITAVAGSLEKDDTLVEPHASAPAIAPAAADSGDGLLSWGASLGAEPDKPATPPADSAPPPAPASDAGAPAASEDPFTALGPASATAAAPPAETSSSTVDPIFNIPPPPAEAPLFGGSAIEPPAAPPPAALPSTADAAPPADPPLAVVGQLLDAADGPAMVLTDEVAAPVEASVRPAMQPAAAPEFDASQPAIAQLPFVTGNGAPIATGAADILAPDTAGAVAVEPALAAGAEDAASHKHPAPVGVAADTRPRGPVPWLIAAGIGLALGAGTLGMVKWWQSEPIEISWFRSANDKVRAGELLEAVSLYQNVLQRDPEFALAYRHLGIAFAMSGEHDQAKTYLVKYLEKGKDRDDLNRVRAYLGLPTR